MAPSSSAASALPPGTCGRSSCGKSARPDHHATPIQDPQFDEWYRQQAKERDRQKWQALLHQIQQQVYDDVRFLPIWELGFLCAAGPRAAVSGLGLIPMFAYSDPYEDVWVHS
jgi:ABC-type transport system substrate-binding protein